MELRRRLQLAWEEGGARRSPRRVAVMVWSHGVGYDGNQLTEKALSALHGGSANFDSEFCAYLALRGLYCTTVSAYLLYINKCLQIEVIFIVRNATLSSLVYVYCTCIPR